MDKKGLYEMLLLASPFPACLYDKYVQDNIQSKTINRFNSHSLLKFNDEFSCIQNRKLNEMALLDKGSFKKCLESCESYNHPSVFSWSNNSVEDIYFFIALPLVYDPNEKTRLILIVPNLKHISFTSPLLTEEAWHEINNPLAIISLTLQKAIKKDVLDQGEIDNLFDKVKNSFSRIEKYISDQAQKSENV